MTRIDSDIQARVDALLLEQGAFAPLELLFGSGRLSYEDYERWRRGEIDSLDSALMGNPEKIKAELEEACSYAQSIGLVEEAREFHSWSDSGAHQPGGGKRLRISADGPLARLIGSVYRSARNAPQLDLFVDNPVVALTNGIANGLAACNRAEAQLHLDRLYVEAPNHPALAAYDRLVGALGHLKRTVEDPRNELGLLFATAPLAARLLGSRASDLLTPLWEQLAGALAGLPFSPAEPALHRSFALSQAGDWHGVAECVLGESNWWVHAPLCLRLALSGFHRQHRLHNLTGWFQLCWRSPDAAAKALDARDQTDEAMATRWAAFTDSESRGALEPEDFPAWMLLQEPGLAQLLPLDLPTGSTAGESHYRCVHRWIHARRMGRHEEEMAQRKALMVSHPVLFQWLKRSL